MKQGIIFNIQRFSLHDGPGIRTTVFLKGCSLDCLWCHNPESKRMAPQLAWMQSRCVGCGLCETVCTSGVHGHGDAGKTVDFEKCVGCGECVAACPSAALEMMGKWVTPEEVLEEVERDMPFYVNSGGGMTLSGGEPAMQPEFAAHLLREAKKRGIQTAMETAGHMPWQVYRQFLQDLDLVLFDSKQMDSTLHKAYTGQPNTLIHENLRNFCRADCPVAVIVRTPVIPGYNDDPENFKKLAAFIHTLERTPSVQVLPYNPLAGSKHPRLGMVYTPQVNEKPENTPENLCQILQSAGICAEVMH